MMTAKNKITFLLDQFITISILGAALSGCGAYSSRMSCPDSMGLQCKMMHVIDAKIDSGEIDKVYKTECKGKECEDAESREDLPLNSGVPIKAKINDVKTGDNTAYKTPDGQYLIIK